MQISGFFGIWLISTGHITHIRRILPSISHHFHACRYWCWKDLPRPQFPSIYRLHYISATSPHWVLALQQRKSVVLPLATSSMPSHISFRYESEGVWPVAIVSQLVNEPAKLLISADRHATLASYSLSSRPPSTHKHTIWPFTVSLPSTHSPKFSRQIILCRWGWAAWKDEEVFSFIGTYDRLSDQAGELW